MKSEHAAGQMKMEPRTTVYKNVETGVYYVQPYTRGPVAATWFGEPTVIRPEDFSSKIADAVIRNIQKFGRDKFDVSKATRLSPKQQREFLDKHVEVHISKPESGGLVISPLRREGGGRVGSGVVIALAENDLPDKLVDAIAEAFKRAT